MKSAFNAAQRVEVKEVVAAGFKGPEIRDELTKRRIEAVKVALLIN
jgi:tRNA nucleotidyltransferase (CCA-adding enzyme)